MLKNINKCSLLFVVLSFCKPLNSQSPINAIKNSTFNLCTKYSSVNLKTLDKDGNTFSLKNKHLSAFCTRNYFYKKLDSKLKKPSQLVGFNKTHANITTNKNLSEFKKITPYVFNSDSIKSKKFKPNAFWIGYNYNMTNNKLKPDSSFFHDAWSIEAGVGRYYYSRDEKVFPNEWVIAGYGVGLEYRQLFNNYRNNFVDSSFRRDFKKVYLNLRAEVGFRIDLFNRTWGFHGQFGYTTNFSQSYLRPGLGVSIWRLQLGGEYYWKLGRQSKDVQQFGFYIRYIITFNQQKNKKSELYGPEETITTEIY